MPNWLYLALTIPSISAFIGWVTNWQAVKMIFWPARFIGVGKIGWQGIIYHHADKFAAYLGRVARDDLMSGAEMMQRLDPAELDRLIAPVFDAELPRLAADAADLVRPGAWQALPPPVQQMVLAQVKTRTSSMSRELIAELSDETVRLLDVQELVRLQLSGSNVDRLSRLTYEIGKKEFKFIEWSGGVFGAIIGFAQLGAWSVFQLWWTMPIFGVIVGLVTNWLAIQMIFRPYERRRYLGVFPYQGLFPRRQAEIAADYARTTAGEVITARNIIDLLTSGERGAALLARLRAAVSARVAASWKEVQPMVPVPVSPAQLDQLSDLLVARMVEAAPRVRPAAEAYLDAQLDVRRTVESRLGGLPKPEFERLLRGVFQEDELTLIIVGGVLGGLVGCLQAAVAVAA